MRIRFDARKSQEVKRQHGISLEEAVEIFDQIYLADQKNDDPAQFRAIGWVGDKLYSVIFEVRNDAEGEFIHLITLWRSTSQERKLHEENS